MDNKSFDPQDYRAHKVEEGLGPHEFVPGTTGLSNRCRQIGCNRLRTARVHLTGGEPTAPGPGLGTTYAPPSSPPVGTVVQGTTSDDITVVMFVVDDGGPGRLDVTGRQGYIGWNDALLEYGPLTVIGHVRP